MLPIHFNDVTGDVVTMLGNIVASFYTLGSLVVLFSYSCFAQYLLMVWSLSFLDMLDWS